jgi:hypothetical protein
VVGSDGGLRRASAAGADDRAMPQRRPRLALSMKRRRRGPAKWHHRSILGPRGEVRCGPDRVSRLLLGGVGRRSGRRRAAPRTEGIRVIRISVLAVAEGRIAETIAADTGRCCLALRHAIKAAARHVPRDIRAAKLGGACIRRDHCTKSDRREQCRSGRGCCFQKLFHHVLLFSLVSALAPEPKWDIRIGAPQ